MNLRFERSLLYNNLLPGLVTALWVLFVVMLPRYTDIAKTWYLLLILSGFFYLLFNPRKIADTTLAERAFLLAVLLNFVWIASTFYINGEPGRGDSFLWGRHFYFPFLIGLFLLFRKVVIADRVILLALFASVALSLVDILIDLAQGIDHRLQGMNPNGFGPIQLCLSAILLFYFIHRRADSLRWLALLGAVLGIATVIFSKSKSTWLTLVVLSVLFVAYLTRRLAIWQRLTLGIGFLLLLSSLYALPIVHDRIDYGLDNLADYFASEDYRDPSRVGSFGTRMELWKTGWYIFTENPALGVGVGGFQVEARKNSERYRVNPVVHDFKYVHNQYIAALATRGIPGLVLLLLVLSLPIYIAMRHKSADSESAVARLALILISLTYIVGCLAEDHFEGKAATMFVSVMLPLMLARLSPGRATDSSGDTLT